MYVPRLVSLDGIYIQPNEVVFIWPHVAGRCDITLKNHEKITVNISAVAASSIINAEIVRSGRS